MPDDQCSYPSISYLACTGSCDLAIGNCFNTDPFPPHALSKNCVSTQNTCSDEQQFYCLDGKNWTWIERITLDETERHFMWLRLRRPLASLLRDAKSLLDKIPRESTEEKDRALHFCHVLQTVLILHGQDDLMGMKRLGKEARIVPSVPWKEDEIGDEDLMAWSHGLGYRIEVIEIPRPVALRTMRRILLEHVVYALRPNFSGKDEEEEVASYPPFKQAFSKYKSRDDESAKRSFCFRLSQTFFFVLAMLPSSLDEEIKKSGVTFAKLSVFPDKTEDLVRVRDAFERVLDTTREDAWATSATAERLLCQGLKSLGVRGTKDLFKFEEQKQKRTPPPEPPPRRRRF